MPPRGSNIYVDGLLEDDDLRFIFVGGKGGVGKTTTSSALSCQLAFSKKVLLISTDPAHSLSDAFRQKFSGEPQGVVGIPNLEVMEVNPDKFLKDEVSSWAGIATEAGFGDSDLFSKISDFQSWLTGIPGIDEATALSSVIGLVESGKYDVIVFDTAPTGHTLKLLQMPDIMQIGLNKLESWQSTIWNYWELLRAGGQTNPSSLKRKVASRIRSYKHGIEKVGMMLKDSKRTAFVVVCIAEYLSINETQRLLQELRKDKVNATHVVVNQLIRDSLSLGESRDVEQILKPSHIDLWNRVRSTIDLCNARNAIQSKYLQELLRFPECRDLSIVQVPLLHKEITGAESLLSLSEYLLPPHYRSDEQVRPQLLSNRADLVKRRLYDTDEDDNGLLNEGDCVVIMGLEKAAQYNGRIGMIVKITDDGRVAVRLQEKEDQGGKHKVLSLKSENVCLCNEPEQSGFL